MNVYIFFYLFKDVGISESSKLRKINTFDAKRNEGHGEVSEEIGDEYSDSDTDGEEEIEKERVRKRENFPPSNTQ